MNMDEKKTRGGSAGAAAAAVLILLSVLLPILYFLSVGPVAWYYESHHIEPDIYVITIYSPLEWLHENCEPLQPAMDWYIELWL